MEQQLWDLLRAVGGRGQPLALGALAARTGSSGGIRFLPFLVWISTLPHRGVPSKEKWQELRCNLV